MHPGMDKATAFHWTVYYMVFLRNALRQQDPPIIPKLHEVRVIVCTAARLFREWGTPSIKPRLCEGLTLSTE